MERRKFVIGMGALATGSAAAMGTGALGVSWSDRDMTVNVADDSAAYIGLTEAGSPYSETDGGQLAINFGNNGEDGEGLNSNSEVYITDVFKITNQTNETLQITVGEGENTNWNTEYPRAGWSHESLSGSANWADMEGEWNDGERPVLDSGESVYVHFHFKGRVNDYDESDAPETVNVYAEATSRDSTDD